MKHGRRVFDHLLDLVENLKNGLDTLLFRSVRNDAEMHGRYDYEHSIREL